MWETKKFEVLGDFVVYRLFDICVYIKIHIHMVGKTNCGKKKGLRGVVECDICIYFNK